MFRSIPVSDITCDDLHFQEVFEICNENFKYVKNELLKSYNKVYIMLYVLYTGNRPYKDDVEDFMIENTTDDLIAKYFELYSKQHGPSKLGLFEIFNDYMECFIDVDSRFNKISNYNIYKARRELISNYIPINDHVLKKSLEIVRLDTHEFSLLNQILVTRMHRIQHQLTGYFFEYLLALSLGKFNKNAVYVPTNVETPVFQSSAIESFFNALTDKDSIPKKVNTAKRYSPKINWFKNSYDYLLYCAILHINTLDRRPSGLYNEKILELIEFIQHPDVINELDEYWDNIKTNPLIQHWCTDKSFCHGHSINMVDKVQVHGEIDFLSSKTVYDIKCSMLLTQDNLHLIRQYLYQTLYYAKLTSEDILNLVIVNLSTNQIYGFQIKQCDNRISNDRKFESYIDSEEFEEN